MPKLYVLEDEIADWPDLREVLHGLGRERVVLEQTCDSLTQQLILDVSSDDFNPRDFVFIIDIWLPVTSFQQPSTQVWYSGEPMLIYEEGLGVTTPTEGSYAGVDYVRKILRSDGSPFAFSPVALYSQLPRLGGVLDREIEKLKVFSTNKAEIGDFLKMDVSSVQSFRDWVESRMQRGDQ